MSQSRGSRKSTGIGTLAALLLVLSVSPLPAHAGRADPIYNVPSHPIPANAQKLTLEGVGRTIIIAGGLRHWRLETLGPGRLRATQDSGGPQAVVDVAFIQQAYSVAPVSTVNLGQDGDRINGHYNLWIRNPERDIEDHLCVASVEAK